MTLRVNEIYGPTFQGEGPTIGMPCSFLRLAICNLHCGWCDTFYTWNFGNGGGETRWGLPTVRREDELHEMEIEDVAKKLKELDTRNLVISGGEPLLQQKGLIPLLEALGGKRVVGDLEEPELALEVNFKGLERVEVETNGTVFLLPEMSKLLDGINCSPKLQSSGNPKDARYKPEVLKQYQATGKAIFKFVICSDADLEEVKQIVDECGLSEVWLMPQGRTRDEQLAWQKQVSELAIAEGWSFSPRAHILMHDNVRGF